MKRPTTNLAVSVSALALLISDALAASSGEFSVLSMNVAGLPDFLNNNEVPGDKTTNSGLIGTKFAQYDYDIIHVQEVRTIFCLPLGSLCIDDS